MRDSLEQIRAERDADEARYAAGTLTIGEVATRAAERCARKRAIWAAADHCDGCPFRGCDGCKYQGGTDPAERANQPVLWEDGATQLHTARGPGLSSETSLATPLAAKPRRK